MKRVPLETVHEIWTELAALSEAEAKPRFDAFANQQPFILAYMVDLDEEMRPKNSELSLIFMTLVVWEALSTRSKTPLAQVTPEQLDAAEEASNNFLEEVEDGSEISFLDEVKELMANYNQMPLLGAILEALVEEGGGTVEDADEHIGLIFMRFKTVVDCLDQ